MKKSLLFLLLLNFFLMDTSFASKERDKKENVDTLLNYQEEIFEYKKLEGQILKSSRHYIQKIENSESLSGDDLYHIRELFDELYKINKKIMKFSDEYKFLKSSKIAQLLENENGDEDEKIPKEFLKRHFLKLLSPLIVVDHMSRILESLYANNGTYRRIFKNSIKDEIDSKENKNKFKEFSKLFLSVQEIVKSTKFNQHINLIILSEKDLREKINGNLELTFLLDEIIASETARKIGRGEGFSEISTYAFLDGAASFFNKVIDFLSGVFGNAVGSIKWRKGYLSSDNEAFLILKNKIRPLDILLEKSPFALTDKFIPGHYGHAALYLGTQKELEALGVWDHPKIIPHHDQIRNGKTIIEAVRSGVRLTSLEEFMNIDEVTLMRKKDGLLSSDEVVERFTRGIDQFGKKYDFNFDISTLDKIICSDLIYIVFGNVKWPTHYRVGRATLTPDDLAEILFYKGTRFEMVQNISSNKRHDLEFGKQDDLASFFDYELRDESKSYWKKETKCFSLKKDTPFPSEDFSDGKRVCQTKYKEFFYEENSAL